MILIRSIAVSDTYPLRIEILRNGIANNYKFVGDQYPDTFHLGAFENETCIGIASFMKNTTELFQKENTYQLRGMAIALEQQKKGVGKLLLEKSYVILQQRACPVLWCNAREIALNFYKKQGFIIKGDSFDIPQIGLHYVMWKSIEV